MVAAARLAGLSYRAALALEQQLNRFSLFPTDDWKCEPGNPPNCTLTTKRNKSGLSWFLLEQTPIMPVTNQHGPRPPEFDVKMILTDEGIINLCSATIRVAIFAGAFWSPLLIASKAAITLGKEAVKHAPKVVNVVKIQYDRIRAKFTVTAQFTVGASVVFLLEIGDVPETVCGSLVH